MRIEHFRYMFNRLNGFYLKEHTIMFRKPIEIWNEVTGEGKTFKTLEEALEYEVDGEKVKLNDPPKMVHRSTQKEVFI